LAISAGSLLVLDEAATVAPDLTRDAGKSGWSRSLYALRRGTEFLFGHLEQEGERFAIHSNQDGNGSLSALEDAEVSEARRVVGIAMPV
jgi:hypothetical protein